MIIKFKVDRNKHSYWTVFDNVTRYNSYLYEEKVNSIKELEDYIDNLTESTAANFKFFLYKQAQQTISENQPYLFRRIDFYTKDEEYHVVLTDSLCFVMNDKGVTIERP